MYERRLQPGLNGALSRLLTGEAGVEGGLVCPKKMNCVL